ncbi:MAG TPA: hypothetical protein PLF81_02650, partial [Candidatus Anammoximicrobium sp.]|nr:hypothetical protein [Candidatus Anammoximicrobium sp.]
MGNKWRKLPACEAAIYRKLEAYATENPDRRFSNGVWVRLLAVAVLAGYHPNYIAGGGAQPLAGSPCFVPHSSWRGRVMGGDSVSFTGLDWAVLLIYFVGITAFGLWVSRKIRSSGGYFLGDRKLPWWIMVGQSFGTGTHAENPVAQAGAVFKFGFATIWYQWKNMLITPFY